MRLLLTRPTTNSLALAEQLARQGHDVVISPVMEIYANNTPLPSSQGIGGLAFTSANGVLAMASKLGADADSWRALPAYAVGPQTAQTLQAHGWSHVLQARGDVEALASMIGAEHEKDTGAILHIAGRHRAGNLSAALEAQGLICHLAVLYEAEAAQTLTAAARAALEDDEAPLDGVLFYSQRAARHYLSLAEAAGIQNRPLAYCLSTDIGNIMQAAGYAIKCAATPDEAALLALIAQG